MVACAVFSDFVGACVKERKTLDRDNGFFVAVGQHEAVVSDGEPHGVYTTVKANGKVKHSSILETFFRIKPETTEPFQNL